MPITKFGASLLEALGPQQGRLTNDSGWNRISKGRVIALPQALSWNAEFSAWY